MFRVVRSRGFQCPPRLSSTLETYVEEGGQAGQAGARTGCEGLVHPREAEQIRLGILGRHPSLKDKRHTDTPREQIAIRRRLRGVTGQRAVGAMILDEVCAVGRQGHIDMSPDARGVRLAARFHVRRASAREPSLRAQLLDRLNIGRHGHHTTHGACV
jgi:hypothetical protein